MALEYSLKTFALWKDFKVTAMGTVYPWHVKGSKTAVKINTNIQHLRGKCIFLTGFTNSEAEHLPQTVLHIYSQVSNFPEVLNFAICKA